MIDRLMSRILPTLRQYRVRLAFLLSLSALFFLFAFLELHHVAVWTEVVMGCILSLANAFLGYVFLERIFQLNHRLFIVFSLAGMTLRFVMMIIAVAAVLVVSVVHVGGFIGSFMVSYVLVMCGEIAYIVWKTDRMKPARVAVRAR